MKLERASHEPGELLEFYEQGLCALGALCERTWHDRLEVVAEARAAALWNPQGTLYEVELHFAQADTYVARDAAREVFPDARSRFAWRRHCVLLHCRWNDSSCRTLPRDRQRRRWPKNFGGRKSRHLRWQLTAHPADFNSALSLSPMRTAPLTSIGRSIVWPFHCPAAKRISTSHKKLIFIRLAAKPLPKSSGPRLGPTSETRVAFTSMTQV